VVWVGGRARTARQAEQHPFTPAGLLCCACAAAACQQAQLTPRKGMLVRTLDVGGAGPLSFSVSSVLVC
jgi:hypothetical protein